MGSPAPAPLACPGCRPEFDRKKGEKNAARKSTQPAQPDSTPSEKRGRGAPPGNTNSLKHGFYSRRFREEEVKDLEGVPEDKDMKDELKLLKVLTRRVFELAEDEDGGNFENVAKALAICSNAFRSKSTMLRTQAILGGNTDDVARAIQQAINDVSKELVKVNYG